MAKRSTVLLLIPHLGGGGAERVIELLLRHLPQENFDIHLGLITQSGAGSVQLPAHVSVHGLGANRVRFAAVSLLRLIRRLRPNLILSGIEHLNFLLLFLRPLVPSETRILVRQSGTASGTMRTGGLPPWAMQAYRRLYKRADGIICQSRAMASDLCFAAHISPDLVHVLPNPVDFDGAQRNTQLQPSCCWRGPGPHLLAAGRLAPEKGFDLLLRSFANFRKRSPSADLAIAGAGREEQALRELSRSLGLKESVRFRGYVPSPAKYYSGASLFVLPSRQEGIPNALLEAAAGGLPIVATPASAGLVELLHDKPGVWLARETSANALAEALSAALPLPLGQRFHHRWVEPFRLEKAIPGYVQLIDSTLEKGRHCIA
jgi:glycosyltransferase involved in cell wall biosynthesis